jgi:fused signal recognition particle receptor
MALNWFKKKTKTFAETNDNNAQEPNTPDSDRAGSTESQREEEVGDTIGDPAKASVKLDPSGSDASQDTAPTHPGNILEPPSAADIEASPRKKRSRLFTRLKAGLAKTRDILTTDIDDLFSSKKRIDDDMLEELEELLITSDIGVRTAMDLMKIITKKASKIESPQALKELLRQELLSLLKGIKSEPPTKTSKPHVVIVVGVNGVGKTTTIGKLAARASENGERVLIAAADTFRAAAIEQLTIWAERSGAQIVKHKAEADPAAVAFDSMEAAIARKMDTVFVDTAGRLHTKVNLMEELKKIKRTIANKIPHAPHEVLLVLDATTGQNALSQAKLFHEAIGVTGLALTKLDGTAKGGIVISISQALDIPLQFIGVGEGIEDLQPFDPEQFADALF